jgi:multidrug efflux system membrane fusion protein
MTSKVLKITFRITCACLAIAAIGSGARYIYARNAADRAPAAQSKVAAAAVPVIATKVRQHDVPIVLEGLGTVTPINTATIRTQVQGHTGKRRFRRGQTGQARRRARQDRPTRL